MNTNPKTHEVIKRWYRGDGGGFLSALAAAWQVADSTNRARIESAFSEKFHTWAGFSPIEIALVQLNGLIAEGWEFPDASAKIAVRMSVPIEELTAAYDNQFAKGS